MEAITFIEAHKRYSKLIHDRINRDDDKVIAAEVTHLGDPCGFGDVVARVPILNSEKAIEILPAGLNTGEWK